MGEWTFASMERGVSTADVVIAVVSPAYILSKNCGLEMAFAATHGKPVIPINLGVPFASWPPARVGTTAMEGGQFADEVTGDIKLFVDFGDATEFETKWTHELLPRLMDLNTNPNLSQTGVARGMTGGQQSAGLQTAPATTTTTNSRSRISAQSFGFDGDGGGTPQRRSQSEPSTQHRAGPVTGGAVSASATNQCHVLHESTVTNNSFV